MLEIGTGLASYSAAAAAFCFLLILLILSGLRSETARWLSLTCLISALWAGAQAVAYGWGGSSWLIARNLEVLHSVAWVLFLGGLAKGSIPWLRSKFSQRFFQVLLGITVVILFVLTSIVGMSPPDQLPVLVFRVDMIAHISIAVSGLVLLENLFRRVSSDSVWGLKFLVFGCGTIFCYQFFIYSDALLLGVQNEALFAARGAVSALSVPLLAVAAGRMRSWSIDIHVSRDAVFHTTTVIACGLYLIVVSAVAYQIRHAGGQWGSLLQVILLAVAILMLLVALFSGSIRARLRVFIAKHFFSYRYDYRYEWHRFIGTISAADSRLHERAIVAVANIIESPAGAIWVRDRTGTVYEPAANWNLSADMSNIAATEPLLQRLRQDKGIVNLLEPESGGESQPVSLPRGIFGNPQPWLVVPCKHREQLEGFLVLCRSRAPQKLNWEEYDLLKTVGSQVASYLAEEAALHALVDVEQLERFNKRFAFVVHDIKNIVGQLSLMLSNAEKHGDNPEFQKEVFRTVQNTVSKMNNLLGQLKHTQQEQQQALVPIDVAALVSQATSTWRTAGGVLTLELGDDPMIAMANAEKLVAVVSHLVQNAIDAVDGEGQVLVRLRSEQDCVTLEISDNGPGMDADFIHNRLFRPLQSTKGSGYGIGAYQTRELVREMGGTMDVRSQPGQGTKFTVRLGRPNPATNVELFRVAQDG